MRGRTLWPDPDAECARACRLAARRAFVRRGAARCSHAGGNAARACRTSSGSAAHRLLRRRRTNHDLDLSRPVRGGQESCRRAARRRNRRWRRGGDHAAHQPDFFATLLRRAARRRRCRCRSIRRRGRRSSRIICAARPASSPIAVRALLVTVPEAGRLARLLQPKCRDAASDRHAAGADAAPAGARRAAARPTTSRCCSTPRAAPATRRAWCSRTRTCWPISAPWARRVR